MTIATASVKKIIPNIKQQECIDSINGPVMVLAGPGTGKTTTLIKRIEKMINTGIPGETILALTFSEAAANEMKIRLLTQAGNKASTVTIHTYHAFCSDIIAQNPLRFELLSDFNVIDDLNKHRFMRDSIDEVKPKNLITKTGDPYFYISYLLEAVHDIKLNRVQKNTYFNVLETDANWLPQLSQLKEERKKQEELEKAGKRNRLKTTIKEIDTLENRINKAKEVWVIAEKYNKKLAQNGFIDFDDMINLVLNTFDEDPAFLDEIREKYKYILVDEYQDTNHSQNELIFKLASDSSDANICVVGDDDQIIYSFQGAQIDNLERFLQYYPAARVVCLNENNRSTQSILDFCYNLITQDTARLENNEAFSSYEISKRLQACSKKVIDKDKEVEIHSFNDSIQENNFIADRIQSIITEQPEIPMSEIAVLTRTNSELENFADLLKSRNIPYQISRQKDIFTLKPSILVYFYLKALDNHIMNSMGLFGLIAHPPFSIAIEDYTFISKEASRTYKDFITVIKVNQNKHKWHNPEKITDFINTFEELKELINEERLSNLLGAIINKTGILEYFVSQKVNRFENISSLKKLVDEVKTFEKITRPSTLTMFLTYLDNSIKENISINIEDNDFIENAVQLITVHKSKGREFSYLFLTNAIAKNWEKRRSIEHLKLPISKAEFSKESEIARLLFVACSRSRHDLFITYSNIINGKNTELSKFFQNLTSDERLVKTVNHDLESDQYLEEVINMFSLAKLHQHKNFKEDLSLRAKKHIMSPSSLYLYENCPKQFLYSYIYRIPVLDPINKYFSFGTAIHKALEKFLKSAMQKRSYADKNTLVKYFTQAIEKELFPSMQERENSKSYGINVLNNYYIHLTSEQIGNLIATEMNLDLISVDKFLIKGKIDLVKRNENSNYTLIDYKTGNRNTSKSSVMNEEGSHSHYLDQIRFYKLLYEQKYIGKKADLGVLVFVEAPEKSIYINLTDEDSNSIREKILNTFEKIHNLEFAGVDEVSQKAKPCEKCLYKMLCSLGTL